jgi:hypothetical protein
VGSAHQRASPQADAIVFSGWAILRMRSKLVCERWPDEPLEDSFRSTGRFRSSGNPLAAHAELKSPSARKPGGLPPREHFGQSLVCRTVLCNALGINLPPTAPTAGPRTASAPKRVAATEKSLARGPEALNRVSAAMATGRGTATASEPGSVLNPAPTA